MAYVPNAQDTSQPAGDKSVASAAPEFRTLKEYVQEQNGVIDGFQAQLDLLEQAIGAGDNSVALAANLANANIGGTLVGWKQNGSSFVRDVRAKLFDQAVTAEDFGAIGDGIANDYFALNLALAVSDAVELLPGRTYNLGNNTLVIPARCKIWSNGPRLGTILTRTGAGPIITTPELCAECQIRGIYFTGTGNTGIYTPPAGTGPFRSYWIKPVVEFCDFAYNLAYGIKSCLIYAFINDCTFGFYGSGPAPAVGSSTMLGIWSEHTFSNNFSNLNTYSKCIFQCGNNTNAAVTIIGGINNHFYRCDFSNGGIAVDLRDAYSDFEHCWSENCVTTVGIFKVDGSTGSGRCTFRYCQLDYSAARCVFFYTSGLVQYFDVHDCILGSSSPTNTLFYDNNTTLTTLPGNGSIAFWNNQVTTSNTGDKTKDVNFRGGVSGVRFQCIVNTASGFTYSSDPAIAFAAGATGICTISGGSMPWASSTGRVMVKIQPLNGTVSQASYTVASLNNFTITLKNGAGANTAGDCYVEVCGM